MQKVNRTGEIVLTVFGAIASILGVLFVFLLSKGLSNSNEINEIKDQMLADGFGPEEVDLAFNFLHASSTYFIIVAIVSLIVGIIAMILLIGDKKPKAAGILLIVSSIIILFASIFMGFFAFLFYLIAGIMAVVRKRKEPVTVEEDTTFDLS